MNKFNLAIAAVTLIMSVIMVLAVVHQPFSWWAIPFVTLFGTLFLGMLAICVAVFREDRFRAHARNTYPDQPWMWDAKWQSNEIPSNSKTSFRSGVAFSIILAMLALICLAQIVDKLPEGNLWVLLGLVPVFAAAYIGRQTYLAWIALKLDRSISLELQTRPAWVGSSLSAKLRMPDRITRQHLSAHLELLKTIEQEDIDGTSFTTIVDRRLNGDIDTFQSSNGQAITTISIDVPDKSPETGWTDDDSQRWELVIAIQDQGKEIPIRFDVPIADPEHHKRPE